MAASAACGLSLTGGRLPGSPARFQRTRKPAATFAVRVAGESMTEGGAVSGRYRPRRSSANGRRRLDRAGAAGRGIHGQALSQEGRADLAASREPGVRKHRTQRRLGLRSVGRDREIDPHAVIVGADRPGRLPWTWTTWLRFCRRCINKAVTPAPRGLRAGGSDDQRHLGSTPAHGGTSSNSPSTCFHTSVHPRTRGTYWLSRPEAASVRPDAGNIRTGGRTRAVSGRFTPAHGEHTSRRTNKSVRVRGRRPNGAGLRAGRSTRAHAETLVPVIFASYSRLTRADAGFPRARQGRTRAPLRGVKS